MIRYQFKEEEGSMGVILRPVADVVLERGEFRVEIPMYIDSGADISMIPIDSVRLLGLSKKKRIIFRK
jgi:hypothetical protein